MRTVLFIEDNEEIRENMGEILELASYNVLLAADGKEGVAAALAHKPDIIICDIMMPELDGYGVIHLLQKHPETRNIPFIFLTAKAERAELRKGMELGADDYITKPFSGTELLNAIEGRLRKSDHAKLVYGQGEVTSAEHKSIQDIFAENQESSSYKKKQLIYSEGQRAFRLFQVASGKVKIFKTNEDGKDLITDICQAGEFFGYTALFGNATYSEHAEALEPSEINSITREVFETAIYSNSSAAHQWIQLLAGNVREKEKQLIGLAYNSLRKKVAEALIMLNNKYKTGHEKDTTVSISRENLASIAGTAKESLIRTLGDFKDEGLIEIKDSEIVIMQEKKLAKLLN